MASILKIYMSPYSTKNHLILMKYRVLKHIATCAKFCRKTQNPVRIRYDTIR